MLPDKANLFYWYGTNADYNTTWSLILVIGLSITLFFVALWLLISAAIKRKVRKGVIGAVLIILAIYFWLTVHGSLSAWSAGLASTLTRDYPNIFESASVESLTKELPENLWDATQKDTHLPLAAFTIMGRQPHQLKYFKSSQGWFELDFVYAGGQDLYWGVRVSSRGDFSKMPLRSRAHRISQHAMVYAATGL